MNRGFGRLFIIDGIIKDVDSFNIENVKNFLNDCPDRIKMTKITPPMVYEIGGKIIGMIIIAESHISFHGDLNTGEFYIDVFSCTFFNYYEAKEVVKKYFPYIEHKVKIDFLERGLEFRRC